MRLEEERLCCLVIVGVRVDGTKELVAIADGYRESTESWADLLRATPVVARDRSACARRGSKVIALVRRCAGTVTTSHSMDGLDRPDASSASRAQVLRSARSASPAVQTAIAA